MSDGTKIEWTEATWNPITGCSVVSPGCTNCYAMKLAGTRMQHHPSRAGLTKPSKAGPVWTGEVRFNEEWLDQPLRWKRPRMIFVCAHGDLFHEDVPDAWIDRVFAVMALAPQHTFQVLTKRAERMRAYLAAVPDRQEGETARPINVLEHAAHDMFEDLGWDGGVAASRAYEAVKDWPLPNVWLGVSAEDQARADERIPHLLATPAAVRWVSAEPLLGPIDLSWAMTRNPFEMATGFLRRGHFSPGAETLRPLDWIVAGGESGPGARPHDGDWLRSIRDQCAVAGIAFFFKQHGEWIDVRDLRRLPGGGGPGFGRFDHCQQDVVHDVVRIGKKAAGALLDGVEHKAWPGRSA